ncbi:GlxA family transcriptional regulator [Arhodomonas sp. SL1]|uniref:GlxA family transcriptional regulator n=1 Tax=Arhodomonas sp. SL1 TaxID=3425691 RepID=UPI003F881EBB
MDSFAEQIMQTGHIPEHLAGSPRPLNALDNGHNAERFGFLLVPGFTYVGFACAVEPLRLANMVAGEARFEAVTATPDGAPVRASNGVLTAPDFSIRELPPLDALFVCGPNPIAYPDERRLVGWLRMLAGRRVALGGIDTGSYLLARAGLLDGYRCTIHWQDREEMLSRFPDIVVSNHLFELDGDRYTSSGGTAAMDMMLQLIARRDDSGRLAAAVADLLVHDRVRDDREPQRVPLRQRLGTSQPRLREAIMIMEANIEEPLRLNELAGHVGLSERQLERLFRRHLDCPPSQYYMELRLNTARQRLLFSEESVTEVARSCGFLSGSHFTRRYTALFGISPSEERRRHP